MFHKLIIFLFYFVNIVNSHMCNVLIPFPANCTEITSENVRVCQVYDYNGNEIFYGNIPKDNVINCITFDLGSNKN